MQPRCLEKRCRTGSYGLAWPGPRLLLYNLNSAKLTSIFSPSPPCPITLAQPLVPHLVSLTPLPSHCHPHPSPSPCHPNPITLTQSPSPHHPHPVTVTPTSPPSPLYPYPVTVTPTPGTPPPSPLYPHLFYSYIVSLCWSKME
jgi:hypothetical protein